MSDERGEMRGFRSRFPWYGADLQTLRNYIVRPAGGLPGRSDELTFVMPKGRSGAGPVDRLLGALHVPAGTAARPLVVLIHGLTGCQDSFYILRSAGYWLAQGHPVMRLNLRGAGPSRPLCREQYHAGRSEDLEAVFAALDPGLTAPGLIAVGYSLGANVLLKYLGERGRGARLLAAASVSAPIDLAASADRFHAPRNRIYLRWLLARMKEEATAPGAVLSDDERAAILGARTVREFDDRFVAPRNGFDSAARYYAECAATGFLDRIEVPTVLVHARNDPWIPAAAYEAYDWRRNTRLEPVLASGGGHVGFHGRGAEVAWHDRVIGAFVRETTGAKARTAAAG